MEKFVNIMMEKSKDQYGRIAKRLLQEPMILLFLAMLLLTLLP
jgi:hypothetical protein